jgi:DNA-binding MarR family transcriptional regulator
MTDLSKDRLRLWLRLLKVSRRIEGDLRERLREGHGTTLPRFDVLAALARAGSALRMSDLSGELRVSNGNVTGLVDRLEAEGLVARLAAEGDRRATLVRLTAKGHAHFDTLASAHEAWVSRALGGLSADDVAELLRLLGRVGGEGNERGAA